MKTVSHPRGVPLRNCELKTVLVIKQVEIHKKKPFSACRSVALWNDCKKTAPRGKRCSLLPIAIFLGKSIMQVDQI
jgi:hypothetical protein